MFVPIFLQIVDHYCMCVASVWWYDSTAYPSCVFNHVSHEYPPWKNQLYFLKEDIWSSNMNIVHPDYSLCCLWLSPAQPLYKCHTLCNATVKKNKQKHKNKQLLAVLLNYVYVLHKVYFYKLLFNPWCGILLCKVEY